ncbi:MAG: hypothetical protein JWL78_1188 [Chloroflexi bacterium]|nr:hypothetical protein [Chloroflexota bacterium]
MNRPVSLVIGHVLSAVGCAAAVPGTAGAGLLAVLLPLLVTIRARIGARARTDG